MQPKISLRQRIAIAVMAVADIIMLILAAILDSLRESMPTEYTLISGNIKASHPLDRFGIAVAVALVLVTVMLALALVDILSSDSKKRRSRIIGFIVLFAVSAAAVSFSYFWVRGSQPQRTHTYDCTDGNVNLLLMEENHSDDFGTLKVFITDQAHDELVLLAATDIHSRSSSSDDYYIDWVADRDLRITFLDGDSYRSIQIDFNRVLTAEQQEKFMYSDDSGTHDHEHDHEHE